MQLALEVTCGISTRSQLRRDLLLPRSDVGTQPTASTLWKASTRGRDERWRLFEVAPGSTLGTHLCSPLASVRGHRSLETSASLGSGGRLRVNQPSHYTVDAILSQLLQWFFPPVLVSPPKPG